MTYELKVMVGVPASGKFTFARQQIENFEECHLAVCYISRDNIRKSFLDLNDRYFDKEKEVFNEFVRQINEAMELSIDVVIADATHISPQSRNKLLSRLYPDPNTQLTFEVMKTPVDVCLNRNANRNGLERVPNSSIQSMLKGFTIPDIDEFPKDNWGFKSIKVNIHESESYK